MKRFLFLFFILLSILSFSTTAWIGFDYVFPSQNAPKIFAGKDIPVYLLFPLRIDFENEKVKEDTLIYGFSFSTNKIFDILPSDHRYNNYLLEFKGRTDVFKLSLEKDSLRFGVNFSVGTLLERFSQAGPHNPGADFGEDGYFHYQNLNFFSLTGSAGIYVIIPFTLSEKDVQVSYTFGVRNSILLLPFKDNLSAYNGNIELNYYNVLLINSLVVGIKF